MSARRVMQWMLGLLCSALAPVSEAQYGASSFGVFDSNGALIGRALDLGYSTADGSISYVLFMAQVGAHAILGTAESNALQIGTSPFVFFEGAGCTGQAWIPTLSVTISPPFLVDPSATVGIDHRVYFGSRSEFPQTVAYQSYGDAGCVDAPGSANGLVKASVAGTSPGFVGPFHVAPLTTTTTASASVAAVTPAALAFLAAVLMLTGMVFAGARAKRR